MNYGTESKYYPYSFTWVNEKADLIGVKNTMVVMKA
jgi:hypothetical protein